MAKKDKNTKKDKGGKVKLKSIKNDLCFIGENLEAAVEQKEQEATALENAHQYVGEAYSAICEQDFKEARKSLKAARKELKAVRKAA